MHAAIELHETFNALGLPQTRIARLFGVGPRSVRRWQHGDRRVPRGVDIMLHLLAAGAVTIEQIEAVAVSIPVARTNGGAKPEPAPIPAVARAVYALAPGTCRWPIGDPRQPDFRFCGRPAVEGPYCARHRVAAYLTSPTGSGGRGANHAVDAGSKARKLNGNNRVGITRRSDFPP